MFTVQNLQLARGTNTTNTQGKFTTTTHTYKDLTATIANILALFPDYLGEGEDQDVIAVGDHILIKGSDGSSYNAILDLAPFTVGPDLFSGASGLSMGAIVAATDNNVGKITGQVLQMQVSDATHPGIISTAAQTIAGIKSFSAGKIILDNANVFFDNGVTIAGQSILSFASGDYLSYSTAGDSLSMNVASTPVMLLTSAGLLRANAFDALAASPLGIGQLNATAITLYKDTTLPATKILKTDLINETTALNGTVINGTTVKGATVALSGGTTFMDNEVLAGFARVGFDSGDLISYEKATNEFSVKIANADIMLIGSSYGVQSNTGFDRITNGNLSIGATHATNILMGSDVTMEAANVVFTNAIEEVTASAGTIINGTTVKGTKITLADTNVYWDNATVTAGEIQMHFTAAGSKFLYDTGTNAFAFAIGGASPSHRLEITASQTYSVNQMNLGAGLQFSVIGVDPNQSIMSDYVEETVTSTFTNATQTSAAVNIILRRIGKNVTLRLESGSVPTQVTPVTKFTSNTAIAAKYRPATSFFAFIRSLNATIGAIGMIAIRNDGILEIYSSIDGATPFTGGVTIGWDGSSWSYPVA